MPAILTAQNPCTKTKRLSYDENGTVVFETAKNYPNVKFWTRKPLEVPNTLPALLETLTAVADQGAVVVHGNLDPDCPIPLDQPAQRLFHPQPNHPATLCDPGPITLFCCDIDGLVTPHNPLEDMGLFADAVDEILDLGGCSYLLQFTSSQRPDGEGPSRFRVWALLAKPTSLSDIKQWALGKKAEGVPIDASIYSPAQIVYLAPPIVIDGKNNPTHDPIPQRWFLIDREHDRLTLRIPKTAPKNHTGSISPAGGDFYAALARIGVDGFHEPIRTAVFQGARQGLDDDVIINAVQAAARQADPDHRPQSYIESEISPATLTRSIAGAKIRLATLSAPPGEELPQYCGLPYLEPLPVETAQKKIKDGVNAFLTAPQPNTALLIRGGVGLGKTHLTAKAITETDLSVLWLSPTLKQQAEVAPILQAVEYRGRGAPISELMPDKPMCPRHAGIEQIRPKYGPRADSEVCIWPSWKRSPNCFLQRDCQWCHQDAVKKNPRRVVAQHKLACGEGKPRVLRRDFQVVVVDESPANVWVQITNRFEIDLLTMAAVYPHPQAVEAIKAAIDSKPEPYREVFESIAQGGIEFDPKGTSALWILPSFAQAVLRYLDGAINGVWVEDRPDGRLVRWTRLELNPAIQGQPMILLDATGDLEIWQALLPGYQITVLEAPVDPGLDIIQVTDTQMGKRQLTGETAHQLAPVALLARTKGAALITHKGALETAKKQGYLPENWPTANFNGLRGLNRLKECQALVVAGRIEPPASEIEALARGLWPDKPLLFGPLQRQSGQVGGVAVVVNGHADSLINRVLVQYRDAELLQAIGRLRGVHGTRRKCYLITNVPLPVSVVPIPVQDALLPDRLARLLFSGNFDITLNFETADKLLPGEWKNRDSFKKWVQERVSFALKDIYKEKLTLSPSEGIYNPHLALNEQAQRGGKVKRLVLTPIAIEYVSEENQGPILNIVSQLPLLEEDWRFIIQRIQGLPYREAEMLLTQYCGNWAIGGRFQANTELRISTEGS